MTKAAEIVVIAVSLEHTDKSSDYIYRVRMGQKGIARLDPYMGKNKIGELQMANQLHMERNYSMCGN